MTRAFHTFTTQDRAAFQLLGLPEPAEQHDVDAVDRRWRELRSQLHPDRGGDPLEFAAAKRAYDIARFCSLEPRPCPTCAGSGKIEKPSKRGLSTTIYLNCSTCRGSGLQ